MKVKQLMRKLLESEQMVMKMKYQGDKPAAAQWKNLRNVWVMLFRGALAEVVKKLPPCGFKNFLYRLMGVNIGKKVVMFPNADLDVAVGELITIEDNVVLGFGCKVVSDSLTQDEIKLAKVVIRERAVIGGHSLVAPGVTVGRNSIVAAYSLVNKDVPDHTMVGGVPAKTIKKL